MKKILTLLGALALALTAFAQAQAQEPSLHPRVKLTTTLGDIVLELDAEKAPVSTMNFIQYVEDGYYEGTIFHRVIADFMIQGGGYTPDMQQKMEGMRPPIRNEWKNGLKNQRGTISMARTRNPNSATSQFFINVVDNTMLDEPRDGAAYAVFGKVVEGMDVVDKIRDAKLISHPEYPSPQPVTPDPPVVITKAAVVAPLDKAKVEAVLKAEEEAAMKAQREAAEKQKAEIVEVVKKAEEETGKKAAQTESGLYYITITEGAGESPKPTDTVRVHYRGTLTNGKEFDNSYDRGQPLTVQLNRLIPGWIEGIGLMKPGGKSKLIIPGELGYGPAGAGDVIPPNATLLFDVELLAVNPPQQ